MTDTQVEAFIEEGFLSYDDLTFVEPAQLAELAGITEEEADEIIVYAEGAAEQVEEETRAAKLAAEENGTQQAPSGASHSGHPTAADIFPADVESPVQAEPTPTLESLFGPDEVAKPEEVAVSEPVHQANEQVAEEQSPAS